jgi:uncharacterized membrane protein (DUF2068 family)
VCIAFSDVAAGSVRPLRLHIGDEPPDISDCEKEVSFIAVACHCKKGMRMLPDRGGERCIDKPPAHPKTTDVPLTSTETETQQTAEVPEHIQARDTGLFLIGLFKLGKAIFFLGVSLGALHFIHHDLTGWFEQVVHELHVDPESRIVDFVTDRLALVTHHRLRLISVGTFLYAGLCTTEAYGLLRRRVWAEFVTLWLSCSFLPWETYELVRRPSWWHVGILLANLVVVGYLLWMLRRNRTRKQSA